MSTFWLKAFELIVSLGLLVFIHELGHYTFSRLFKVKVDKFYLFFNPWFSIVSWNPKKHKVTFFKNPKDPKPAENEDKQEADIADAAPAEVPTHKEIQAEEMPENGKSTWRDTTYGIGWLPLGGYCAINGMIDETTNAKDLSNEVHPWEFRAKPAWQRLLIMVGGVLFNFLLAIVIYAGMVYYWGEEYLPFKSATDGLVYSETAHKAGFVDNDIPLTADGAQVEFFDTDQLKILSASKVQVLRGTDTVTLNLPKNFMMQVNSDLENDIQFMTVNVPVVVKQTQPRGGAEKAGLKEGDKFLAVNGVPTRTYEVFTENLKKNKSKTVPMTMLRGTDTLTVNMEIDGDGKLGFELQNDASKIFKTVNHSYNIFQSIPRGIEKGCKQLVDYVKAFKYVFTSEGAKSLGGFGSIGHIFPDHWDWYSFWSITAFLSVILAFMNILPIPALDGGHVLFLLFEIIFRRKPSEKFMERAQMAGMIFLIALLLFANGNDIYRFFFK